MAYTKGYNSRNDGIEVSVGLKASEAEKYAMQL